MWQTAMLRLTKLRLRDEVNDAMRYFELSLLSQVPQLNAAVNAAFGERPDRERPLLRIGSWIGGDRDGNPFVTAEVLADTFQQQAARALGHHLARVVESGRGAVDVVAPGRGRPGAAATDRGCRRYVAVPARRAVSPGAAGHARPPGGHGAAPDRARAGQPSDR